MNRYGHDIPLDQTSLTPSHDWQDHLFHARSVQTVRQQVIMVMNQTRILCQLRNGGFAMGHRGKDRRFVLSAHQDKHMGSTHNNLTKCLAGNRGRSALDHPCSGLKRMPMTEPTRQAKGRRIIDLSKRFSARTASRWSFSYLRQFIHDPGILHILLVASEPLYRSNPSP